jgi:indole-3-glycerol phosphate synthase
LIPKGVLSVSESGIRDSADISYLNGLGIDAVLVGEALMRAPDKKTALAQMRAAKCAANCGRAL